jgi:hypothetical protein
MENKKRTLLWLAGLAITAGLSLAGALIGKTIPGYILYGVGTAGVLALLVLAFASRGFFKDGHIRPLILGLVLGLFLVSSSLIFIEHGMKVTPVSSNNTTMMSALRTTTGSSGGNFQNFRGSSGSFTGGTGNFTRGSSGSSSTSANTAAIRAAALRNLFITLLGWLFFIVGIIILMMAAIKFLKKQTLYSERRWQMLLLGLVVSGLISASTTHMLLPESRQRSSRYPAQAAGQQFIPNGTMQPGMPGQGTVVPMDVTATPTPVPTTAVPTVTPTYKPTQTPTLLVLKTVVTCLNPDTRVGLIIHDFPSDTAAMVGTIPPGGCFTLNGRSSQYPGWYRMAPGQNGGGGGIQVYVDDTVSPLWIHAVDIDAAAENLASLADVDVNE